MAISLPGSQGLFSHIQQDLRHVKVNRVALTKGVYQDLEDFPWMAQDLEWRSTFLYELVPLQPTLDC